MNKRSLNLLILAGLLALLKFVFVPFSDWKATTIKTINKDKEEIALAKSYSKTLDQRLKHIDTLKKLHEQELKRCLVSDEKQKIQTTQILEQKFIEFIAQKNNTKITYSRWQEQVFFDENLSRLPLSFFVGGKASDIHKFIQEFEKMKPYAQIRSFRFRPRGPYGEAGIELKVSYIFYTKKSNKEKS